MDPEIGRVLGSKNHNALEVRMLFVICDLKIYSIVVLLLTKFALLLKIHESFYFVLIICYFRIMCYILDVGKDAGLSEGRRQCRTRRAFAKCDRRLHQPHFLLQQGTVQTFL